MRMPALVIVWMMSVAIDKASRSLLAEKNSLQKEVMSPDVVADDAHPLELLGDLPSRDRRLFFAREMRSHAVHDRRRGGFGGEGIPALIMRCATPMLQRRAGLPPWFALLTSLPRLKVVGFPAVHAATGWVRACRLPCFGMSLHAL